MTSIITPNDPGYWEFQAKQYQLLSLEQLKTLEKLVGQVRNDTDQEALLRALNEAENLIKRANNILPSNTTNHLQGGALVTKEDEHSNNVVAALVSLSNNLSSDQTKVIYDAITLIEGENG